MTGRTLIVTGADGFIGRNLCLRVSELAGWSTIPLTRSSAAADWSDAVLRGDVVIHLAGVNRPPEPSGFAGNPDSVAQLTDAIRQAGRSIPIILASSAKASERSEYGASKNAAEDLVLAHARENATAVALFRLPNVFGKWCRPNYNSAVATFCHNVARGLPVRIDDPDARLTLVYIDDVVETFIKLAETSFETGYHHVEPQYEASVGELAAIIQGFRADRAENMIAEVGYGLRRALYSTYVSYLPKEEFSYPIATYGDARGVFSEMLKTRTSGQFSFFTALPGVTRGGHYHHSKTEKFLIVHGAACFRFRHMLTGETFEIHTSAERPEVVETIPGWAHDVTNVGDDVMVSMLWANEIFDRSRPDTITAKVASS